MEDSNVQHELFEKKQRIVAKFNEKSGFLQEIKELNDFENQQRIEFSKSNDIKSKTSGKITIVTTNDPKLLLYEACNFFYPNRRELFDKENILICAEQLKQFSKKEKNEILNDFNLVLASNPKLNVYIDCSNVTYINPIWINNNKITNYIFIVNSQTGRTKLINKVKILKDALKVEINYNWGYLTTSSQKLLLEKKDRLSREPKFFYTSTSRRRSKNSIKCQGYKYAGIAG